MRWSQEEFDHVYSLFLQAWEAKVFGFENA